MWSREMHNEDFNFPSAIKLFTSNLTFKLGVGRKMYLWSHYPTNVIGMVGFDVGQLSCVRNHSLVTNLGLCILVGFFYVKFEVK